MGVLAIILTILDLAVCVVLILLVMLQEGSNKGLGVISGGNQNENFFGQNANKGRSRDVRLRKMTSYSAILFVILTVILYLITGRG
ncbi:MAG: preprotein translocase subunit SecG [Clostridiaceae bacterium]|nr:preprotein translocase subunit SecG [Clostridiaceae bacterium]